MGTCASSPMLAACRKQHLCAEAHCLHTLRCAAAAAHLRGECVRGEEGPQQQGDQEELHLGGGCCDWKCVRGA